MSWIVKVVKYYMPGNKKIHTLEKSDRYGNTKTGMGLTAAENVIEHSTSKISGASEKDAVPVFNYLFPTF